MQVSHIQDHVTHAVIGGKKPIDFSISSSAEFFNILSRTLYSDQILAVVREVLCNAWDAHIQAGITNKPVEVTISSEKMVIKDFGSGIHHDDIGPIYGTYGSSTKANDGLQTGGFGLGCKAPFAYTDHFEVISCHKGVKTIYNMSKSSAQVMGKPGIIPIATLPTTETGITVTIPLKDRNDYARFHELLHRIARNGEMNVNINNNRAEIIEFSKHPHGFLITQDRVLGKFSEIMVRYGNVIYPVEKVDEIRDLYTKIYERVAKINPAHYEDKFQIIFQAPPHSISVTPSREALSMQEHTINTLKRIFKDFLDLMDTRFEQQCTISADDCIKEAVANKNVGKLLNRETTLPITASIKEKNSYKYIATIEALALQFLKRRYPESVQFRKTDLHRRLDYLSKDKLVDRGLAYSYIKQIKKIETLPERHTYRYREETSDWFKKRIVKRLVTKMTENDLMELDRLYAYDYNSSYWSSRTINNKPALIPIKSLPDNHLFNDLVYLRKVIVLSYSKNDVRDRLRNNPIIGTFSTDGGFLFYQVSRRTNAADIARDFFTKQGMEIIDLTVRQSYEVVEEKAPRIQVKKEKKQGLPILSSIQKGNRVNVKFHWEKDVARIEDPEFVLTLPVKKDTPLELIGYFTLEATRDIISLFGSRGAIACSITQMNLWKAKGVKSFDQFLIEEVVKYIDGNSRIEEHMQFCPERVSETADYYRQGDIKRILTMIHQSPLLLQEFKLKSPLTKEDRQYLSIFKSMLRDHKFKTEKSVANLQAKLDKIPIHKNNADLLQKLQNNPLLDLIDVSGVQHLLKESGTKPAVIQKVFSILLTAING